MILSIVVVKKCLKLLGRVLSFSATTFCPFLLFNRVCLLCNCTCARATSATSNIYFQLIFYFFSCYPTSFYFQALTKENRTTKKNTHTTHRARKRERDREKVKLRANDDNTLTIKIVAKHNDKNGISMREEKLTSKFAKKLYDINIWRGQNHDFF